MSSGLAPGRSTRPQLPRKSVSPETRAPGRFTFLDQEALGAGGVARCVEQPHPHLAHLDDVAARRGAPGRDSETPGHLDETVGFVGVYVDRDRIPALEQARQALDLHAEDRAARRGPGGSG